MTQAKILVSGATGNVGTQLVKRLAASNTPFKALIRNADSSHWLQSLPQAEILIGDMADQPTLIHALEGVEKAFLLTPSSEQAETLQGNFVDAAVKAGVKHLVKLSQLAASENSPVRFLRYHARVENRILRSGLAYTFLRPNLYMQGFLAFSELIKNEGKFYAAIGNAAISAVDVRDIAAVAERALTETGHENRVYNITGPQALTHQEMADVFTRTLGRKIAFIDVAPGQMEGALRAARFPEWQVGGVIEDYAHYARGEAAVVDDTVRAVTNNAPTGFEQFVQDHKAFY